MSEAVLEIQVKQIMVDLLNVGMDSLDEHASMDTIENWDSLAHINLIFALEEEYDIMFDVEEFVDITTLSNLLAVVQEKM